MAKNSVFAAFYGLLVTHFFAHRFTLGKSILAIQIKHLLKGNVALSMDVYYVKVKFTLFCTNLCVFCEKKNIKKFYVCKVCDKLNVCFESPL